MVNGTNRALECYDALKQAFLFLKKEKAILSVMAYNHQSFMICDKQISQTIDKKKSGKFHQNGHIVCNYYRLMISGSSYVEIAN
jgi:hypothetical protein